MVSFEIDLFLINSTSGIDNESKIKVIRKGQNFISIASFLFALIGFVFMIVENELSFDPTNENYKVFVLLFKIFC
jgi:hypothetical protein